MYSRDHLLLSVLAGAGAAWYLSLPIPWWAAVIYAGVLGVGIDVDHFLVERVVRGEWTAARRCLADPLLVFRDQSDIFETGSIWPLQRLLSHVVIGGLAVAGLALFDVPLAVLTAVVLYVHVLADLVWDNYRHDRYQRQHARAVRDEEVAADLD